jgi:hypothetical protein
MKRSLKDAEAGERVYLCDGMFARKKDDGTAQGNGVCSA